jgi:hypothetical protein
MDNPFYKARQTENIQRRPNDTPVRKTESFLLMPFISHACFAA